MHDPVGAKHWQQNNTYVKTLININISDNERVHTQGHTTAHQMWSNLKTIYESSDSLVYTDKLQTIFQIRASKTTNITEHLKKLKKNWDQLSLYNDQLTGDVLFKHIIAQSLPYSWNTFTNKYVRGCIDKADSDPTKRVTSQQLISLINQEYNLNESQKHKEVSAHKRSDKNSSSSNANRGVSGSSKKKHCNHCRHNNHNDPDCKYKGQTKCSECKRFHDGQECWKRSNKHSWKGKEKETPSGSNKKHKEVHITEEGSDKQANLAKAYGQFQLVPDIIEVNPAADIDIENKQDDLIHQVESYVNIVAHDSKYENLDSYEWVADSASTVHVTHQRQAFATYGLVPKISITGIGGMKVFMVGMGTVYLITEYNERIMTLQLNDVLHVPGNLRNLMSIPLWEEPAGQGTHFEDHQVVLTMNKTAQKAGTPIAKGPKINSRLY